MAETHHSLELVTMSPSTASSKIDEKSSRECIDNIPSTSSTIDEVKYFFECDEVRSTSSNIPKQERLPCEPNKMKSFNIHREIRCLRIVSGFSFLLIILSIGGGWLANSLAIAINTTPLLFTIATFLVSIDALYIAQNQHPGNQRAELLVAFVSIIGTWILTGILLYLTVVKFVKNDFNVESINMMIFAGLGMLGNGLGLATLICFERSSSSNAVLHAADPLPENSDIDDFETEATKKSVPVQLEPVYSDSPTVRSSNVIIGCISLNTSIMAIVIIINYKPEYMWLDYLYSSSVGIFVLGTVGIELTWKLFMTVKKRWSLC